MSLFHRLGSLGVIFLVLCGSRYDALRRLQKKETKIITRGKDTMQQIMEKSTVALPLKQLLAFYEPCEFIIEFTRAGHWSLS
jgi:hypothetical protein